MQAARTGYNDFETLKGKEQFRLPQIWPPSAPGVDPVPPGGNARAVWSFAECLRP